MEDTQQSKDQEFSPGCSSVHQKRSEAESSCVSVRSDGSMDRPIRFKSEDTKTDLSSVHQKRSGAESSCVSVRSDVSMDRPIRFKSGDTKTDLSSVHQKRSEAESSCVSVRSDGSMDRPIRFKSEDTKTDLSSLLAGLPDSSIKPSLLIQNTAARLIFHELKRTHITPLLINLHWIPLAACITFKA